MGEPKSVPDNRHLQLRGRTWYVRVAVPPSLVRKAGRASILKSLQTRDVAEARSRRWPMVAKIKAELDELKGAKAWCPVALGLKWRAAIASSDDEPNDDNPQGMSERDLTIDDMHLEREELEDAGRAADADLMYRLATDTGTVIEDAGRKWLRELEGRVTSQTIKQHGHALSLLKKHLPAVVLTTDLDRRKAGLFVTDKLQPSGRAQKTVNRIVSSLSAFWKWMIRRGLAEANPWEGQGDFAKKRGKAKAGKERPYTPHELVRLLTADPGTTLKGRYGPPTRDLLRLGLATGARLNELCELRVEDVKVADRVLFFIPEGKTASARRAIPVLEAVWPILERRLGTAEGGQLFPELKPGGPDGKRSWYVSKRFTQYRRTVLGEDSTVDFHSLRRSFATYLEHATTASLKVNPSVIAELMGHQKGTLALSVYSGGLRLQHLKDAIAVLWEVMEPEVREALALASEQGAP
jgi:integrase